jgi:hypothetical protein
LQAVASRRPRRDISGDRGELYLRRYFILAIGPRGDPWLVAYLHHFIGSDPARGLHDHPWPWALTWVLAGGYVEETMSPTGRRRFKPRETGSMAAFGGDHLHRVLLAPGRSAWTLFVHGPWRKPWGFFTLADRSKTLNLQTQQRGVRLTVTYFEYSSANSAGWWRK